MAGGWLLGNLGRLQGEMARIGNQAYDDTLGSLGGWFGDHVWGQNGPLADYTRGLNTMSLGGATGLGIPGMLWSQDLGYRQEGSTPGRAAGQLGAMQGESILAMLSAMGGSAAYGALGAGSSGAAGGSGLGSGGVFSGALGESSTAPSFFGSIPSIGETGTANFTTGYLGAGESLIPSIGGTGAATFGSGGGTSFLDSMMNNLMNQSSSRGKSSGRGGSEEMYGGSMGGRQQRPEYLDVTRRLLDQIIPILISPRPVMTPQSAEVGGQI